MQPIYDIAESDKSFDEAADDLDAAIQRHGFVILTRHDVGESLRKRGIDFAEDCRVYDIDNPALSARLLDTDMRAALALPCRVAVWSENGTTRIGLMRRTASCAAVSPSAAAAALAGEIEQRIMQMIGDAR